MGPVHLDTLALESYPHRLSSTQTISGMRLWADPCVVKGICVDMKFHTRVEGGIPMFS